MENINNETGKIVVDARGLSCPEPVIRTKKALDGLSGGHVEVLVGTATSRNNVTRYAENKGWRVTSRDNGDDGYKLILEK